MNAARTAAALGGDHYGEWWRCSWPGRRGSNGLSLALRDGERPLIERQRGATLQIDQNGGAAKPEYYRRDINHKPQYAPVAEWRTRELADKFSKAVVEAVHAAHPDVLGGGRKP